LRAGEEEENGLTGFESHLPMFKCDARYLTQISGSEKKKVVQTKNANLLK